VLTLTVLESGGPLLEPGTIFELTNPLPHVMGRSSKAEIRITEPQASRSHVVFIPSDSGWVIEDLSSRNGTRLNDEKLNVKKNLKAGDQIGIGASLFEVTSVAVPQANVDNSATMMDAESAKKGKSRKEKKRKARAARKSRKKVLKGDKSSEKDDVDEQALDAISSGETHAPSLEGSLGTPLEQDDGSVAGGDEEPKSDPFLDVDQIIGDDDLDAGEVSEDKVKDSDDVIEDALEMVEDEEDDLGLAGALGMGSAAVAGNPEESLNVKAKTDDLEDVLEEIVEEPELIEDDGEPVLDMDDVIEAAAQEPESVDDEDVIDDDVLIEDDAPAAPAPVARPKPVPSTPAPDWDDGDFEPDFSDDVECKPLSKEEITNFQTIIGPGTKVNGDLISDAAVAHIYGDVDGNIMGKGAVHIAEGVVCSSKVKASQVIVSGTINGDVSAGRSVQVDANGKIVGNVRTTRFSLADGGEVVGYVSILGKKNDQQDDKEEEEEEPIFYTCDELLTGGRVWLVVLTS